MLFIEQVKYFSCYFKYFVLMILFCFDKVIYYDQFDFIDEDEIKWFIRGYMFRKRQRGFI